MFGEEEELAADGADESGSESEEESEFTTEHTEGHRGGSEGVFGEEAATVCTDGPAEDGAKSEWEGVEA